MKYKEFVWFVLQVVNWALFKFLLWVWRNCYDSKKILDGLWEARHNLDLAVDRICRAKLFASDEERLEHRLKLYEEMTAKEKLV
jgi:hypothetical protein